MPQGPKGGPRPLAKTKLKVSIDLITSDKVRSYIRRIESDSAEMNVLNRELYRIFEEDMGKPVKKIRVNGMSNSISVYLQARTLTVWTEWEDRDNFHEQIVEFFDGKDAPVSSITVVTE